MIVRKLFVIASLALVALSTGALPARPGDTEFRKNADILEDLELTPIRFDPPEVRNTALHGGAVLISAGDGSLPFLTLTLYFSGGINAESVETAGTLDAALNLLETGGAGEADGATVAAELSRLGAKLEFSSGYEFWSVQLTVLKKDFDAAYTILSDSLLKPRLPEPELNVARQAFMAGIERRNDDPSGVARRKTQELLYHGLRRGYSLQKADVEKLSVQGIRKELDRRLRPGGLYVTAAGDFEGLDLNNRLNKLIQGFPNAAADLPVVREASGDDAAMLDRAKALRGKILLVNTPAAQSVISIAGYLPAHDHPDFFALQTGNYVLGGGSFNSRLTREIRVRRGLAYYAYSYNDFDAATGAFYSGSGTRSFLAHQTLALMLETIDGMRAFENTRELDLSKDAILNSLAFQFDSPEEVAYSAVRNRLHRMPEDYLATFPGKIRGLKEDDLRRVAKRYLAPENLYVVIAGPAELKDKLNEVRPVVVIGPEDDLGALLK